jgi:hypothetical protein
MSITPRSKKASPREANSLDASIAARASAVIEIVDHGENPAVSTYLLNCPPVASAVHFAQHKKEIGTFCDEEGRWRRSVEINDGGGEIQSHNFRRVGTTEESSVRAIFCRLQQAIDQY